MAIPYSAPKNTLAYQLGARPLTRMIDFSHVMLPEVMGEFKDTLTPERTYPEADALWFYMMNHAVSMVREKRDMLAPLGEYDWVLQEYHKQMSERAVRAFRYLILICAREARHVHGSMSDKLSMVPELGDVVKAHFKSNASSEDTASTHLQSKPPACTVGEYVIALKTIFYKGQWGGGYGGKAWGKVTDCLVEYVFGRYSAEMMLDTIWTLCHNNGPIFNKGMLYHMYKSLAINMILDVQRSGQIPQAIWEAQAGGQTSLLKTWITPELFNMLKRLNVALPGLVPMEKPYVDWFLVESLGGVHNWKDQQQVQTQKYGASADLEQLQHQESLKVLLANKNAIKAEANAAAVKASTNTWEVFPGEHLEKFTPTREDAKQKELAS